MSVAAVLNAMQLPVFNRRACVANALAEIKKLKSFKMTKFFIYQY